MTIDIVRDAFLWCFIINMGILLWWFLFITFANNWVYRTHCKWYKIPKETFDAIHYGGIALFKIIIFAFNLVPYIALKIAG